MAISNINDNNIDVLLKSVKSDKNFDSNKVINNKWDLAEYLLVDNTINSVLLLLIIKALGVNLIIFIDKKIRSPIRLLSAGSKRLKTHLGD
jgi:hypothetical protein